MAFPALFVVPAYSAVMAARIEVVTTMPLKPIMYMVRLELTLSCSLPFHVSRRTHHSRAKLGGLTMHPTDCR